MKDGKLQWHSAFYAAIRIELEEELDKVHMEEEHLLGKKPMQMDMLIIKKEKMVKINKNIGHIFREHNIIEYKSPDDYLGINDFYKAYGYVCFYQSDTEEEDQIDPEELTITFICNHYPRKMLAHIDKVRGIKAVKIGEGIYQLYGDPIPMQLVITKELSKERNYWLQNLRKDLKSGGEIKNLMEHYEDKKFLPRYQAVMDVILRANWEAVEEERTMCEALRELFADDIRESERNGILLAVGIYKTISRFPEKTNQELAEQFSCTVETVEEVKRAFAD